MPEDAPILVVGFDRSRGGTEALRGAAAIGERLGAHLVVVHAVDLDDYPVDPDRDDWDGRVREVLEEERRTVEALLTDYRAGWSLRVIRTDPVRALVDSGDELDALMIVVGSESHGLGRLLHHFGTPSVAHRLVAIASRPVLVVGYHPDR